MSPLSYHSPYSTRPQSARALRLYRLRSLYRALRNSLAMSASAAYGIARFATFN